MEFSYSPEGVCSMRMTFKIENDVIEYMHIIGGCQGNTQGICKLVRGRNIDDVIELLQGIDCGGRGTSCPDQVAQALIKYKQEYKEVE